MKNNKQDIKSDKDNIFLLILLILSLLVGFLVFWQIIKTKAQKSSSDNGHPEEKITNEETDEAYEAEKDSFFSSFNLPKLGLPKFSLPKISTSSKPEEPEKTSENGGTIPTSYRNVWI